jgi:hypothetical protein
MFFTGAHHCLCDARRAGKTEAACKLTQTNIVRTLQVAEQCTDGSVEAK